MSKIQEQNDLIRKRYLNMNPHGVNLRKVDYQPMSQHLNAEELKLLTTIKQENSNPSGHLKTSQKRVPKSPIFETSFMHEDESGGSSWEQAYQYVLIATCNAPVVKANYDLKVEVTVKPTFAMKAITRTMKQPIKVMEPPRAGRVKMPDLTKEVNQNAKNLEGLLVYPKIEGASMPAELKPICLPGGHFRLVQQKNKSKRPQEKITQQDQVYHSDWLPAPEEDHLGMVSLVKKGGG